MLTTSLVYKNQFDFQREHAEGKVLNVGCHIDGANLKRDFGAVNLDCRLTDIVSGDLLPVDVLADARNLPYEKEFDTVVLGEILEHMTEEDAVTALKQAKKAIKDSGVVVITIPHDNRERPVVSEEHTYYAPGVFAFHHKLFTKEDVEKWLWLAGLRPIKWACIEYVWGVNGSGIVTEKANVA